MPNVETKRYYYVTLLVHIVNGNRLYSVIFLICENFRTNLTVENMHTVNINRNLATWSGISDISEG